MGCRVVKDLLLKEGMENCHMLVQYNTIYMNRLASLIPGDFVVPMDDWIDTQAQMKSTITLTERMDV